MVKIQFCITILFLIANNIYSQSLRINEIMASNASIIVDEDGDYSDWLEIYNSDNSTVNLNGYNLSDDQNNLTKWQFGEILLNPNEYLLVFASDKDRYGEIFNWNNVIDWGDEWKYIVPNSELPENWNTLEFDDNDWQTGPTGIGYGDDDDETIISSTISLFARKKFYVEAIDNVIGAILHIDYDDAFVAYLNGVEIARENIGTPGIPPAFDQLAADEDFEAKVYQGGFPSRYDVDDIQSVLVEGENILSVQVHNLDSESSDLTFIPFFTIQQSSSTNATIPPSLLQLAVSGIHTNFKIKTNGELLILSDPNGNIIDSVSTGFLPTDISLGRQPDGSETWFYFGEPTPGSANITTGSDSIIVLNDMQFSDKGGFYNSQISLILSSNNENTSIYFTIDGSLPNENSFFYSEPITINNTRVIRAISIHVSGQRSAVITHTYFINENRPLPVFSISMHPQDFELLYENYDAEIPIHIEMYEKNGKKAFSHNAGAEVFGSGSSGFEQKSLSIFFRGKYGVGELKYKLFPDLPFEEYESFILRNGGNDWWSTLIRDAMTSTGLMEGTNLDYQAYRPSVVYLNGKYWGIYNIREKVNEHFIFDHHYVPEDSLDMLEYKEVITPQIIHGDLENYDAMIDFLKNNYLKDSSNYVLAESMIDIDNFLDYQIIEIFCANIDWPANNNKFWRSKSKNGKWRWILYDTDTGFGLWDEWRDYGTPGWELDHFEHATNESGSNEEGWPNPAWSTYIFRMLLQNDEFKYKFVNRFADYLNTQFLTQNVLNTISNYKRGINNALPDHIERWGRSPGDYDEQIEKLNNFATFRPQIVRSQLVDHFNLNESVEVTVKIAPSNSGVLKLNSLIMSNSTWKGIYFSGAPIKLAASPKPGFKFLGWDGALSSESLISVNPKEGMVLTAMFEPDSSKTIVINEINYNSNNTHNPSDWVELFNNNYEVVNISGWSFNDAADTNLFRIPEGSQIKSGEYLVLSKASNKFIEVFSDVTNFIGDFEFGLSSIGDTLRLFDNQGVLVDFVEYSNLMPWAYSSNGNGPTLELINPNMDNTLPESWASSIYLGTPGEQNSSYDIFYYEKNMIDGTESNYGLVQNYPNPFSLSTNIIYGVKNPAQVQLEIYNILGQKVITLVNEFQNSNEYIVTWNGLNSRNQIVSSGVYIYVLKLNYEVAEIKKMIKL